MNEGINIKYQNLWEVSKAMLRGNYIAISAYVNKQERYQVNELTICLKELEKQQQK